MFRAFAPLRQTAGRTIPLPPGANLSTVTALSLGLQMVTDAEKSQFLKASMAAAVTSSASSASSSSSSSPSPSSTSSLLFEPLSWCVPSGKVYRAQDLLEAVRSANHTVAPLPVDAAVICVGAAMDQNQIGDAAAAAWRYPVGAGRLLLRLAEVAEHRPEALLPNAANPRRSAASALVDFTKQLLAHAAETASPPGPVSAVFLTHPDLQLGALRIALLHATTQQAQGATSADSCNLDVRACAWAVEPALEALERARRSHPSLCGLAELAALADPASDQPRRLLELVNAAVARGSSTYVDAAGAADLMLLLLRADMPAEALLMWKWLQHTRADFGPRARSAVVGALAAMRRTGDALELEQRMYDQGYVLEPAVQAALIAAVRAHTDPVLYYRDAKRLYLRARNHWAFELDQLAEPVRVNLLRLLADTINVSGPSSVSGMARAVSRSLYPRKFVGRQRSAHDMATEWIPGSPETIVVLLRALPLTGSIFQRPNALLDKSQQDQQDQQGVGDGDHDDAHTAAEKSAGEAQSQAQQQQQQQPLEELTLLTGAAMQLAGTSTAGDAELWGSVIGAAAACGNRATLVDMALALKTAQADQQFVEDVMLAAVDVMRTRDWELSKLVVAELSKALGVEPSQRVMSRLLAWQPPHQQKQATDDRSTSSSSSSSNANAKRKNKNRAQQQQQQNAESEAPSKPSSADLVSEIFA